METETWKSPRAEQEERRELRMKVATALADCILDNLMQPDEAKKFYIRQFPEVGNE